MTFDQNGNLTSVSDESGITILVWDARNRLVASTSPSISTGFTYDATGRRISKETNDGIREFLYDGPDIAQQVNNQGSTSYLGSLAVDETLGLSNPPGSFFLISDVQRTTFAYDPLNRLTQLADPLNGMTGFTYDPNGNLLRVTDARGNAITHAYDPMDRLATRTDPVGAAEFFVYDGGSNLTQHTDRKGQVATFTYDPLNRRIGAAYADGSSTSFAYDAAGRLLQASDSVGGTILNSYDTLDRLIAQSTGLGTIAYQYDALGRRTRMDAPGQASVFYGYDATSRLRTITQAPLNPVTLDYDTLGRRTLLTLPNGVSTAYQYDSASRLTALIYRNALGPLGDLTYQYDQAGNRTRIGGSFARTLLPDPVPSATYDPANRQLTFGDKSFTYDANGNLTSITDATGVTTFTWNARNQLTGILRLTINTLRIGDIMFIIFFFGAVKNPGRRYIYKRSVIFPGIRSKVLYTSSVNGVGLFGVKLAVLHVGKGG